MSVNTKHVCIASPNWLASRTFQIEAVTMARHWKQTRNSVFWKNSASYKMLVHTFHCSGTMKHVDGACCGEANGTYPLLSTQQRDKTASKTILLAYPYGFVFEQDRQEYIWT
jgi:hypothetical protein